MLSVLISFVSWVLGIYVQLGVPVPGQQEMYMFYTFKKDRAESIESPKLIVMSGSNGRYGIDTEKLGRGLGMPSVNMAITMPLGLEYILHQTRPVIKSGDWILAPLEYQLYRKNYGGERLTKDCIEYALAHDPDYFMAKKPIWKAEFIAGISLRRFFEGLLFTVFPFSNTLEEYPPLPFNKNGDATDNIGQKFNGVTNALEDALLRKEGLSETALRTLSDFIDECRRNGVRFFAAYPSLLYKEVYLSEAARENIAAIEAFYASKNVPVLGTFEDSLYPIEDMYDTRYHLNIEGREKRTRLLLKLLKSYGGRKPAI
ncbi:MAG: hypothetical protein LBR71_06590 [Synergistaceae bacterium]|nr:hypothetical protein [Synergistaceae bacterium]